MIAADKETGDMDTVASLARICAIEGARSWWRWDPRRAAEFFEGPVRALARGLAGTGGSRDTAACLVADFARMGCEAIGLDLLGPPPDRAPARSLRDVFMWNRLPAGLPEVAPARRAGALAEAWNLCDVLDRAPAWLQRFACACAETWSDLSGPLALFESVLRPLLADAPDVELTSGGRLVRLDGARLARGFVPGPVHLAHPRLACVHDRVNTDRHAVVVVQPGEAPRLIGPGPCLGGAESGPRVCVDGAELRVGDRTVRVDEPLPACHAAAASPAGFVVATGEDSQWLWVVDCR